MKSGIAVLVGLMLVGAGCMTKPLPENAVVRTASVALVPEANKDAVQSACTEFEMPDGLQRSGLYLRDIAGQTYLFRYRECASSGCGAWKEMPADLIVPIPEAARKGLVFEPMEQIFYEAGAADKAPDAEVKRIAMFTELKPGKEAHYRLLHDNPWSDVIKAIRKANFRHFSIFLEEIGGRVYLFGWLEYVGEDLAADDAENKKDPASIRWWRETDACQIAPEDAGGGMWGGMEELLFVE